MSHDLLRLIEESRSLNPKLFSLIRMQILSNMYDLGEDGSTYREIKAVLGVSDGALYSNLKALQGMGYVESRSVRVEGKTLESFNITKEGKGAWNEIGIWLRKMLDRGGARE